MLHHISLPVANLERARSMYDPALEALGYRCVFAVDSAIGYGIEDGKDKLCLKLVANPVPAGRGFHLALAAPSRPAVDRFHRAALRWGATDRGAPGLRPQYGPDYYAAFISDPDGNRLEAVCRSSDGS